jgi:hypothetical protein
MRFKGKPCKGNMKVWPRQRAGAVPRRRIVNIASLVDLGKTLI